ncbi:MGMT family protein [Porticoccus litoralis]|uniref:MGMT family protein n=1 Tax=Porticoccus litoralis TaxID=434086 RepID=A0AAW8B0S6_9GAMM|nr:MGMT family protein [Porticoccus litoralis]MDP1520008.1 MGMT family protein [Porticoccus litoralis]TNE85192.1 MAG: cysteine methyltransferase [Gammaproteobacteria bacterium]
MKSEVEVLIYSILSAIPKGQVASYGQVANFARLPKGARLIGRILSRLPPETTLPWHRVLKANGQIAFAPDSSAYHRQKQLLELEGIKVSQGKVDLRLFGWRD